MGALPLDVKAAGIHFLSADSHKWMLGMMGIGAVFVDRSVVGHIHPALIGGAPPTTSTSTASTYELLPDAGRFEEGSLAYPLIAGFSAALELLEEAGIERIAAHVCGLVNDLAGRLEPLGCETAPEPEQRRHMVTFRHRDVPGEVPRGGARRSGRGRIPAAGTDSRLPPPLQHYR